MQRLRAGVRAGVIDPVYGILSKQASLLAKRCQDFTPPRNQAQGRVAVARDLSSIFRPLDQRTFEDKRLRKIIREDNRPAWNAAARHMTGTHKLRNTQAMGFSEEWHRRNRNRRGRTVRAKYGNLGYVTLGAEAKAARNYMKVIKDRVGWARAGWNMGVIAFGGIVTAAWVRRHSVARGQAIDGRNSPDPYVQVINDTGWARSRGSEGNRILRNAIAARARDMEAYAMRMMRLAAAKATGGSVAA